MGLITTVLLGALAIIGAVCVKVFADEFKAWAPSIVAIIIKAAVRTLPAELRERFSEEWLGHINQVPGDVGKIVVACGFLIAALDMAEGPFGLQKRVLDLVLGSLVLVFLGPVLLLTALVVKLDSPGPLLVRQTYIGRNGRPFRAVKFRTKTVDGLRVTAAGELLSSANLDEVPLLASVLSGDMSFVGPRPLAVHEASKCFDEKEAKPTDIYMSCKPGMTGLWLFGYHTKDIASYVGNWSLKLDAKIILATFGVVLTKRKDESGGLDLEAAWKIGLLPIFCIVLIGIAIRLWG